ncbi:unnamed protein product, partial [Nesidiocoris tenuis]
MAQKRRQTLYKDTMRKRTRKKADDRKIEEKFFSLHLSVKYVPEQYSGGVGCTTVNNTQDHVSRKFEKKFFLFLFVYLRFLMKLSPRDEDFTGLFSGDRYIFHGPSIIWNFRKVRTARMHLQSRPGSRASLVAPGDRYDHRAVRIVTSTKQTFCEYHGKGCPAAYDHLTVSKRIKKSGVCESTQLRLIRRTQIRQNVMSFLTRRIQIVYKSAAVDQGRRYGRLRGHTSSQALFNKSQKKRKLLKREEN